MEPIAILVLTGLITSVVTGSVGYAFWTKKQKHKDQKMLEARVQTLEQQVMRFVTEPKVREIVSEEIKVLTEETKSIKGSIAGLSDLIANLRIELGVLNYIKDKSKES